MSCGPLPQEEHPCALHNFDQIAALAANKLVAVFLDYDGAPATCGCALVALPQRKRDTGGVAPLAVPCWRLLLLDAVPWTLLLGSPPFSFLLMALLPSSDCALQAR